jgi:chemotaxis-related protein WspB
MKAIHYPRPASMGRIEAGGDAMLVLTFRIAEVPYAVAVRRIIEVVPRVALRAIPHAPGYLAGLLRYRGGAVPVVDLGLLMGASACRDRLDTRIILIDGGPGSGLLGLIAERVEDIVAVDESRRAVAGLEIEPAPYLGAVYETDDGLLLLVEPGKILAGMATPIPGIGQGVPS